MIEKITNQNQIARHKLAEKINELIEAVNGILDYAPLEMAMKTEPKPAENVQDENPRCPLCGEELFYVQEIDGGFDILTCNCSAGFWLFGNDKMWYNLEKTITELERTRKALEIAKTHLGYIKNNYHSWTPYRDEQMIAQASNCLAKIKELEDGNL